MPKNIIEIIEPNVMLNSDVSSGIFSIWLKSMNPTKKITVKHDNVVARNIAYTLLCELSR